MRRLLLSLYAVAIFVALACQTRAAEQPGIVLLMGDDHGWDETGYNGHRHVKTPVLDEMAATGLRLDRFYSAHPSCSPTRASIITGRHPNRCGTFSPNWSTRPGEPSIAQILKDAGYRCGHFGKWHLGPVKAESPTSPGALGFDEWLSHDNFFELNPVLSHNGADPKMIKGESSEIIIRETIQFIHQSAKSNKPFFAVVWFGSPHEPYEGLPEDLALYDDLPESYADRKVSLTDLKTGKPTNRSFRDVLRERLAEITAMDRAIGTLRDYLKTSGQRDNTLVWYCGDNGVPSSGRLDIPFRGQKGLIYEGGTRVPGVIEWPARITKPRTSDVNSVTTDMLPTLCEIVGAPLPNRPLDGISLTNLFDGSLTSRPQPIGFWMYDTSLETKRGLKPTIAPELQEGTTPLAKMMDGKYTRSFRNFVHPDFNEDDYAGPRSFLDNEYKFVVDGKPGGSSEGELFNLRDDPSETRNLIQMHPEVAARLRKQLHDWQTSVLTSLTTGK